MKKRNNNFRIEIDTKFHDDKRNFEILDRKYQINDPNDKYKRQIKYYKVKCNICGWAENWVREVDLKKYICSCCTGRATVLGINSIKDTHPYMVEYFKYEEDSEKHVKNSKKKVWFKCPTCGNERFLEIGATINTGFSCNICGKYVSMPEKIMSNLLKELNVNFITQYRPVWADGRKYDFYLPSFNMIIETHGGQHYKEFRFKFKHSTLEDRKLIDKTKEVLAFENMIEEYIAIDCKKSDFEYIFNNIKNSKLNDYFDFTNIDFTNIIINSHKSEAATIWEMCKTMNHREIADELKMHFWTVLKYIKLGNKIGKCEYNIKNTSSRSVVKYDLNGNFIKIYDSAINASKEITGTTGCQVGILNCCAKRSKTSHGFLWKYFEDSEFYNKGGE